MEKPEDIPQSDWDASMAFKNRVDASSMSAQEFVARAMMAAREEENEACALEALRWQDGIDAAEHIRRRNRKGA